MRKEPHIKAHLLIVNFYKDDETVWFETLKKKESMNADKSEKDRKENEDEHD